MAYPKKATKPLTQTEIKALLNPKNRKKGMFAVGGATGLFLRIRNAKSASYVYRFMQDQVQYQISLGATDVIGLQEAREKAQELRARRSHGEAIAETLKENKRRQKVVRTLQRKQISTGFKAVCEAWLQSRVEANFWARNIKGEKDTRQKFEKHIYPVLGDIDINQVRAQDLVAVLGPLWIRQTSTARKLICWMRKVFQWALAAEILTRSVNPMSADGPFGILMEPYKKNQKEKDNFSALAVEDLPKFFQELQKEFSWSSLCLQFAILTAARSKAVRNLCWDQIDLKEQVWTIPIENDKIKATKRDRTVFLSHQAIELLKRVPPRAATYVFGDDGDRPMSLMGMEMLIRRLDEQQQARDGIGWIDKEKSKRLGKRCLITQHGTSRATFKTWSRSNVLGNNKRFDQEAVEKCLLHGSNDPYDGAYDRARMFEERREIMQAWGDYCTSLCRQNPLNEKIICHKSKFSI